MRVTLFIAIVAIVPVGASPPISTLRFPTFAPTTVNPKVTHRSEDDHGSIFKHFITTDEQDSGAQFSTGHTALLEKKKTLKSNGKVPIYMPQTASNVQDSSPNPHGPVILEMVPPIPNAEKKTESSNALLFTRALQTTSATPTATPIETPTPSLSQQPTEWSDAEDETIWDSFNLGDNLYVIVLVVVSSFFGGIYFYFYKMRQRM